MKKVWKLLITALTLAAVMACMALPAMAAEEGYKYTVTISAGGLEGAALNAGAVPGAYVTGDKLVIEGVAYGTELSLDDAVLLSADSKYEVRGYVRAGQDYSRAVRTVAVTGDTDLVAAYRVPGQQVAYTVNYQDGDGNALAESQTFYGTIGDKPVATYVYVEGYVPQALNLTKTLSENEAENVFTFVYTPVEQEVIVTAEEAETPVVEGAAAEGAEAAGEAAAEEPAEPQELIDLDEEETPLAQAPDGLEGLDGEEAAGGASGMNKGAVIGGSVAAAAVVIGLLAVLLVTKRKKKA